ncbi:MAG: hypothetical protein JWN80_36 [Microbacteriaceae bacterium]|jgi:hypothetical protein|nr:hypothetical protein [Microbacteriaceae bacterium]
MGFFTKVGQKLGVADSKLIKNGTLALGNVISVKQTGLATGNLGNQDLVCDVTVEVVPLDGSARYQATVTHSIPYMYVPQLQTPGASVAVRVDPADKTRIELDLTHAVPDAPGAAGAAAAAPAQIVLTSDDGTETPLETHQANLTTAEVLATGKSCSVDVLAVFPLGQNDAKGLPASGLILNVHRDGAADFQAQMGIHIPDDKTAKVVVGAKLPAKWVDAGTGNTDDNLVAPEWDKI